MNTRRLHSLIQQSARLIALPACILLPQPCHTIANPPDPKTEAATPVEKNTESKPRQPWMPITSIKSRALLESSGLAPCSSSPDLLWSHNDSGHPPSLFAFDLKGNIRAELRVEPATNVDWEDMTSDRNGTLYIADFGDNQLRRARATIYEIAEPDLSGETPTIAQVQRIWHYKLPVGPRNAEALFIHQNQLYMITKEVQAQPTLFHIQPQGNETSVAKPICRVPVAPITAADVSPDGKQLAVLSYGQLAVFDLSEGLASIESQKPPRIPLPIHKQTEACTFLGKDIIVTAESREVWRFTTSDIAQAPRR
ncbi:MAG: hypothetical protein ACPGXK_08405 [Phycisphaerae bacterium]